MTMILDKGTNDYCSALQAVRMYKSGNCDFRIVEDAINGALDYFARTSSIKFGEYLKEMSIGQLVRYTIEQHFNRFINKTGK